jgi:hypothetical protein
MGDDDKKLNHRLIALTEFGKSTASIIYDPEEKTFILSIDGKNLGPITLHQLKTVNHVLTDVSEMHGKYMFLE